MDLKTTNDYIMDDHERDRYSSSLHHELESQPSALTIFDIDFLCLGCTDDMHDTQYLLTLLIRTLSHPL